MVANLRSFSSADVRLAGMLADVASERTGLWGPQLFLAAFNYVLQEGESSRDIRRQAQMLEEVGQNTREYSTLVHNVLDGLQKKGSRYQLVQYPQETVSCREKERLWQAMDMRNDLASHLGHRAPLGMVKSIVMKYQREGEEKYIVACTLPDKLVDPKELRVEFGLSREEYKSLTHQRIDDISLLLLTGRERGEIGPLMIDKKMSEVEEVYFAEDLMADAQRFPTKLYDVPLTKEHSLLVNAAHLFQVLREINPKYRTNSAREENVPLKVLEWKVRDVDQARAGVPHLFTGTTVRFRDREYVIKNPPKEAGCVALPIPLEVDGIRNQRVVLPISYRMLEERYKQ